MKTIVNDFRPHGAQGNILLKEGQQHCKQLKITFKDHLEVQVCRWPGLEQPGIY